MDKYKAFSIYFEIKQIAEDIQTIEGVYKENGIDVNKFGNLFTSNFNKKMEDIVSDIKMLHSYVIVENDIALMKKISQIPKSPFFFYPLHCAKTITDATEVFSEIQSILSNITIEYENRTLTQQTNNNNSGHKEIVPCQKENISFRSIIQYKDPDELLKRLHQLIDGKKGAAVGCVLLKAKQENYLTGNPTRKQFLSEFELIGTWQAITNYLNENNENALERANRIIIFK